MKIILRIITPIVIVTLIQIHLIQVIQVIVRMDLLILNDSGNTSSKLCCFGYVDYIILASTLAIALGEELDNTDLSILSTFFAVLSDELALITSVNSCSNNTPDETFVAPVPDVAITGDYKNLNVHNKKNRTRVKKIIKKKVKKK